LTLHELLLPERILKLVEDHCRREAPLEACGIISGRGARALHVYPMTNAARSETRYLMVPDEQFRVMEEVWARGEELVAIYHSHPISEAYPSATDVALAYYPEAVYLILSLYPEVKLRGFHIRDGVISEVRITIIREDDEGCE